MIVVSGAAESSMYVIAPEQLELFAAPSVAVARKAVIELSGTETVIPGLANSAAVPVASGAPLQSDEV